MCTSSLHYLWVCFVFFPVWVALMQGQTSILLLVLLSLAFVCLKRRRDGWAGVFVGLGLFKFAVAAPLALIFLLKGKWRLVAGFTWAAFMLGVVSLIAVGPAGMIGYVNLLVDTMRRPTYPPYAIEVSAMPNLRGFFHAILTSVLPGSTTNGVVVLASVFLIGYVAWRWHRQGPGEGQPFDLMFAAALVISQVTAFHLLIHDLSPTLIAVLLTLGSARYPERSPWRPARTAVIAALYVIPACLLMFHAKPMYLLAPVLVLLAWAAMAGSASSFEAGEPGLVPDR
ncbi:MAG: glycosyltransferase family 87 protein [Terriglobia bacterium]